MLFSPHATIDQAIDRLNNMMEADPNAITALIKCRVPCNQALANHPTCQVRPTAEGHEVGLLGVLNGIFGTNSNGSGLISVVSDDKRESFTKFVRTPCDDDE